MKKIFVLIALTVSWNFASATSVKGIAEVEFNPNGAIIFIDGDAATALYDTLTQVKSIPVEGGNTQGFMRVGERYVCTRASYSGQWKTNCLIHVSKLESGEIAKSRE